MNSYPQFSLPEISGQDHIRGARSAPVTVIVYADFQCQRSGQFAALLKKMQYSRTNYFKVVFRHYPLVHHFFAMKAAIAAEAAARQHAFWEMHDLIFEHQHDHSPSILIDHARKIGLLMKVFSTDLTDPLLPTRVNADRVAIAGDVPQETPLVFINGAYLNSELAEDQFAFLTERSPARHSSPQ